MQFDGFLGDAATTERRTWLRLPMSFFIAVAVLAGSGSEGRAQEPANGSEWTFSVSPYLWAAGIEGKSGTLPGLPPADIDQNFSDIFDDLDFAGMLLGTARKGRFGISGNVQYVKTTATSNDLAPLFSSEELISKSLIFDALAEYAVFQTDRSVVRVSGGARLWSVDTELRLAAGVLAGRTISHDEMWLDPVVGVNGSTDVAANVFLTGWGFVGGFGAGSDVMADLFAGIGYRFTDRISATAGYRWMKVDREDGDFLYDVRQEGIIAGLTFLF